MSLINRFEHLPNRPRSDEARPLLEKIASQVKPIMTKRSWKVGTLAEFLPSNPALLGNNMNHGQRINLRLRPPGNESTFYEYDQLVLVMLHELTHIVHGPHDASFYKLLAELEEEYYALKRKGYEGEGFHSAGHHLPGVRRNEYEGRHRGLMAAQKRLDQQRMIGRGGVLGGSKVGTKSMREIVAEAAERRLRDDKACDTNDPSEVEKEVKKAQEESVGIDAADIVDLTNDSDDSDEVPGEKNLPPPSSNVVAKPSKASAGSPDDISSTRLNKRAKANENGKENHPNTSRPQPQQRQPPNSSNSLPAPSEWSCPTCTLLNPMSRSSCEACAGPRPPQVSTKDGWFCEFCGAGPREMGYWSCIECGWVRKWG